MSIVSFVIFVTVTYVQTLTMLAVFTTLACSVIFVIFVRIALLNICEPNVILFKLLFCKISRFSKIRRLF